MSSYICYMDYLLPEQKMDVEGIFHNLSEDKKSSITDMDAHIKRFKEDTRLDRIAYFKDGQEFSEKVYEMVDKMLQAANIDVKKVTYIMCGNEHLFRANHVSTIHSLQADFGFSNSMILPIMHPCAATLCGLKIADKLLEEDKYILIISGCYWENVEDRYIGFTMRGDGVGLTLVSSHGELKVCDNKSLNYNNAVYDIHGAMRHDPSLSRMNLIQKGSEFLVESMKQYKCNEKTIRKIIQPNAGYSVFHDLYSYYAKVNPELFYYDNIADGGHMCDIDIIRNLKDYMEQQEINKGEYLMIYTPDVEPTFDINYYSSLLQKV
ncbi:hypothetical protein [Anaeromicropila populeti]|uniref:3-oxoacyl-[acyl-carrier-protein] synthase-3 n=1 Tax=Anaeromicropila populeti TaxID=37658 RepID=A0A1I6HSQ6_9FIRM|nr:hypothetical protein [Anaeromicropila populeti]SFR57486.1 3-oxoacyl-[acyl-carrier-protein] synthase-3 [Anaeromicropila populeti]